MLVFPFTVSFMRAKTMSVFVHPFIPKTQMRSYLRRLRNPLRLSFAKSMNETNHSRVTEFVLLGLSSTQELQPFLFLIFSLLYLAILLGNFLIILTVTSDPCLHTPMYFLLSCVINLKMLLKKKFMKKYICQPIILYLPKYQSSMRRVLVWLP